MTIRESLSDGIQLPISQSCLALEVSRGGYYKWLKRSELVPSDNSEYMDLKEQIQKIATEFPGYGYRRINSRTPEPWLHG